MCGYTGCHFGAAYPDACCIDGLLWDLDSGDDDGLTNGGECPCPACDTGAYLDGALEDAESTEWGESMGRLYSGAMVFEEALRTAEHANASASLAWKTEKAVVEVFDWPDRAAVLEGRARPETAALTTIAFSHSR